MSENQNAPNAKMTVDGLGVSGTRDISVNLPGNSFKNRNAKKDIPKKTIRQIDGKGKKAFGKRVKEAFAFDNDYDSIMDWLLKSIADTTKRTVYNLFTGSLGMFFGVDAKPQNGYTQYSRAPGQAQVSKVRRGPVNPSDIVLTKDQADEALQSIMEIAQTYDFMSVADFCEICRVKSAFPDNDYGWLSAELINVRKQAVVGGYSIVLPKAHLLER